MRQQATRSQYLSENSLFLLFLVPGPIVFSRNQEAPVNFHSVVQNHTTRTATLLTQYTPWLQEPKINLSELSPSYRRQIKVCPWNTRSKSDKNRSLVPQLKLNKWIQWAICHDLSLLTCTQAWAKGEVMGRYRAKTKKEQKGMGKSYSFECFLSRKAAQAQEITRSQSTTMTKFTHFHRHKIFFF